MPPLTCGRYQFRSHHVGRSYGMGNGSTNIIKRIRKCRDVVFLVIFFTFLVAMIVNSSIGFNEGKPLRSAPTHVMQDFIDSSSVVIVKGVTFRNSQHMTFVISRSKSVRVTGVKFTVSWGSIPMESISLDRMVMNSLELFLKKLNY